MKVSAQWLRVASLLGLVIAGCDRTGTSHPSGSLEATEIDLAPAASGRALEVRAALGEQVLAGDTLVVLDTELLALQKRQTLANQRSIAAQQAAAAEERRQAERNRTLAETTLGRLQALLTQGSTTQQQVDDAAARLDVINSQVAAARHRETVYQAEMERLVAAVAVVDRQLEDGVLVAPSDGTVLMRALEPGELARPTATALRIADLEHLELRIYVEAIALDLVHVGQDIPLRIDALPDERFTGRVSWISAEAEFTPKNAQTREARTQLVYAVKVAVENRDRRLHIGMTAEAEI